MKRGAKRAEFQKGRPPKPLYRKAVTEWMEMAHTTERKTKGMYHVLFGLRLRKRLYSR
jgi:hypothetical protein